MKNKYFEIIKWNSYGFTLFNITIATDDVICIIKFKERFIFIQEGNYWILKLFGYEIKCRPIGTDSVTVYKAERPAAWIFLSMPPLTRSETEPDVLRSLEMSVEKLTGKNIDDIRQMGIDGYRRELEATYKKPTTFISRFPFIGRGNVLRDKIITESVPAELIYYLYYFRV